MKILNRPLFGFWLPYIGWKKITCHPDGEPVLRTDEHEPMPKSTMEHSFFVIEWLGLGCGWARVPK